MSLPDFLTHLAKPVHLEVGALGPVHQPLGFRFMIVVPCQVQDTVNDEQDQLVLGRLLVLAGVLVRALDAEIEFGSEIGFCSVDLEGENICVIIVIERLYIQLPQFLIGHRHNAELELLQSLDLRLRDIFAGSFDRRFQLFGNSERLPCAGSLGELK